MDDATLDKITGDGWNLSSVYRGGLRTWWRQEGDNFGFRITHDDGQDIRMTLSPEELARLDFHVTYGP